MRSSKQNNSTELQHDCDRSNTVQTSSNITWLLVHFIEREDAKLRGARWSPHVRQWYAPAGIDIAPLQKYSMDRPRVYLDCPIEEKDMARSLGAQYDASKYKWYIFETMEREPFERWLSIRCQNQH